MMCMYCALISHYISLLDIKMLYTRIHMIIFNNNNNNNNNNSPNVK